MALLSETNPRSPKCRDCHKPADPGEERCRFHRESHTRLTHLLEFSRPSCLECDARHDGYYRSQFCSETCRNAFYARDAMAFIETARKQLDLAPATGILRRLFGHLRDRDGDECYLCGEQVDIDIRGDLRRRFGPSVDHVIPRSKGGTHDLRNLRLVHKACNSAKGARDAETEVARIRRQS